MSLPAMAVKPHRSCFLRVTGGSRHLLEGRRRSKEEGPIRRTLPRRQYPKPRLLHRHRVCCCRDGVKCRHLWGKADRADYILGFVMEDIPCLRVQRGYGEMRDRKASHYNVIFWFALGNVHKKRQSPILRGASTRQRALSALGPGREALGDSPVKPDKSAYKRQRFHFHHASTQRPCEY
jgi:hypothetical protein